MTAILADVLAYQPEYALMNIFTVAVIGAVAVACAISLRKARGKTS
jgi:hypothetical protein